MYKYLYRIFLLMLIFLVSLGIFTFFMKEHSTVRKIETTEMSDAELPVIAVIRGSVVFNRMYGFDKDTEGGESREEITPAAGGNLLSFVIFNKGNETVSVEYEIKDRADGIAIETGKMELGAPDKEEDETKFDLKTDLSLSPDQDYGLKLVLVKRDGRKVYYYTTLRYTKEEHFKENVAFVKKFHEGTFDKEKEGAVKPYLETDGSTDNASFAHVNIHSSYDLVTWGNLKPERVTEPRISLLENNPNTGAFLYNYVVSTGKEKKSYFHVREYYRVNYTERAMYLLSFDRTMEEIYDPEKTSLQKKQLKFGISEKNTEVLASDENKYVGFVRERELWQFDTGKNKLSLVFSFRKEGSFDEREILDRHRVRLLRIHANGDMYFSVYGYMNRGVYEGRTALVLYKYYKKDDRIEEQACFPFDFSYWRLITDMDRFSHMSGEEIFYFGMQGRLYAFSLIKRKAEVMNEGEERGRYLSLNRNRQIAWEGGKEDGDITVLNLENRIKTKISPENGKTLSLLGKVDDNIIYGIAKKEEITQNKDGSILIPNERILIAEPTGKILKEYKKRGIYIASVRVKNRVIELQRLIKKNGGFEETEGDHILNNFVPHKEEVEITERRTEKNLTEYYLKLPAETEMKEQPEVAKNIENTVILSDTVVKLKEEKEVGNRFYANVCGKIGASSENAGEMIRLANEGMGFVTDSGGRAVWERGTLKSEAKAEEVDIDYREKKDDGIRAATRLFLTAKGIYISDRELYEGKSAIMDILEREEEIRPINLTGAELSEVLYYIGKGSPVIALEGEKAVLIIAYSGTGITLIDAKTGKTEIIKKEDAEKRFQASGNVFISTIE